MISQRARDAVKPALWGVAAGVMLTLVIGILTGALTPWWKANALSETGARQALLPICAEMYVAAGGTVEKLKKAGERDYDDVVIAHVKKVGNRIVSTSDRPFAKACGFEVLKLETASGKTATK